MGNPTEGFCDDQSGACRNAAMKQKLRRGAELVLSLSQPEWAIRLLRDGTDVIFFR